LENLRDGQNVDIGTGVDRVLVPANADQLATLLEDMPKATLISGSTDTGLWVTKFMRDIGPAIFIGGLDDLKDIDAGDDGLTLGAGVTYTEAADMLAMHFPHLKDFWARIGGEQVRNMGTIGGNIANGSPIGDTPPPLIALGATITLRKGTKRRVVLLEDYFIAYGKQDRVPGEFVESIHIPWKHEDDVLAVYKISKRRDEDISSLCAAFKIKLSGNKVQEAIIAFGGMAATPKRAANTEKMLTGKTWDLTAMEAAEATLEKDFAPISDMRASAEYRMLTAQNLLRRFYMETTGETQVQLVREVAQ
jgi:xanthine dehydrogenase small subunit